MSVGLADVVARCLSQAPEERYAQAGALAADLRRHLAHLPLQGVVNRDLGERWRKWRQRRPQALIRAGAALLALLALVICMGLWEVHLREQTRLAQQALAEGEDLLGRGDAEAAARAFQRGQKTGWFPGGAPLRQRLAAQERTAAAALREQHQQKNRQRLSAELSRLADSLRFFWDVDTLPLPAVRTLEQRCASLWEKRWALPDAGPTERERNDLIELPGLWAQLEARLADPKQQPEAAARALQRLDEMKQALGPSLTLDLELPALCAWVEGPRRGDAANRLGLLHPRASAAPRGQGGSGGRLLQRCGRPPARRLLAELLPGACAHRLRQDEEAVAAFRTCIALAPQAAPCYLNRALALLRLNRTGPVLADLDRAIHLAPDLADAWLQRGLVLAKARRLDDALHDLHRAVELGGDPARCHYNLAQVYRARGETAQAVRHARQALQSQPGHAGARQLLEALTKKGGP